MRTNTGIKNLYLDLLHSRVVVFDGAMGTNLDRLNLSPSDYGGSQYVGCNDSLNLTKPDAVASVHRSFLEVGVDVIETNTFRSNRYTLREFGLEDQVTAINEAGAQIARRCAGEFTQDNLRRLVAGSIGPTGKLLCLPDNPTRAPDFDEIRNAFCEQAVALIAGGVDLVLLETMQDILEIKAAILGIQDAFLKTGCRVPLQVQVTVDASGRMLLGTDISAAATILQGMQVDVFGINCSTGPREMRPVLHTLNRECPLPLSCLPNAGIPVNQNGKAIYTLSPQDFATAMVAYVDTYHLSVVVGCCGTTPEHLKLLLERLSGRPAAHKETTFEPRLASAFHSMRLRQSPPPLIIGERLNAQGSRRFKDILLKEDLNAVLPIAEEQIRFGAHALDISVALSETNTEAHWIQQIVRLLSTKFDMPLVIDTTEPDVMEAALKAAPGRCLLNSINLESGEKKARRVLALARNFNAAVIALTIDEHGMAGSAQEKLEIASRIYKIAVEEFGLRPEDLIVDPLTFTLASGSTETAQAGQATLEALSIIKSALPGVFTCLGISNISYGLPATARVVLNSVFLYHAVQNGLDMAILNPTSIQPYPSIPKMDRRLAEDLIFRRRPEALEEVIAHFSEKKPLETRVQRKRNASLPLEERIRRRILHREKDGLAADLDAYIKTHGDLEKSSTALSLFKDILLPAMQEIGNQFANGELILPFVLGSAEVMQAATAHLEPYLAGANAPKKGKLILATVYGDVHDLGKNLVHTILANNGYEVIDLGKQVPADRIITQTIESGADAVGLSALLVSTSQQMPLVVDGLREKGLEIPILIGGAAVNKDFAHRISGAEDGNPYKGGVHYCQDAFDALKVLNRIPSGRHPKRQTIAVHPKSTPTEAPAPDTTLFEAQLIPQPPFWGARILDGIPFEELFKHLNRPALYRISRGAKNAGGEKWESYKHTFDQKLEEFRRQLEGENWLDPAAAYGFFPCKTEGGDLVVFNAKDHSEDDPVRFHLRRQGDAAGSSLADYFAPAGSGMIDVGIFQIVTMGQRAARHVQHLQEQSAILQAYFAHGLAVQLTEAAAQWLHAHIRAQLAFPPDRGKRYSWGYPLLPDLFQHELLFRLLPAQDIGIELTSAYQFIPEYSTAALVVHHPQAAYAGTKPLERRLI